MNITQQIFCICNFIAIVNIFTYKNITLWLKEGKELFGMIASSKTWTNYFNMTKWILLWLDPFWMPPSPFSEALFGKKVLEEAPNILVNFIWEVVPTWVMTFIDEDDFSSHHVVHVGDVFGNLFLLVIYCTNVKDC